MTDTVTQPETPAAPLTPEQLRRAVATEVMGLWVYHYGKGLPGYYMLCRPPIEPVADYPDNQRATESEAWQDCPGYDYDPATIPAVLARVAELNLKASFILALAAIKGVKQPFNTLETFELLAAQPEEVAAAALAAVRSPNR